MWRALTPAARAAHPLAGFAAAYAAADRAAGVLAGRRAGDRATSTAGGSRWPSPPGRPTSGRCAARSPCRWRGAAPAPGVDWNPALLLPGLRPGEVVARTAGPRPARAAILAADGTRLDATGLGAGLAGVAGPRPTGLERIYDRRLGGHPSERLMFGERVVGADRRRPRPDAADDASGRG